MTDLDRQIAFLLEADKLKSVVRATTLADGSRHENSAEHSWHLALFALVLQNQAPVGVDIHRVIQMLLIHDIVEIDAGDAPIFDEVDIEAMEAAEAKGAERLFGLLPASQGAALKALWHEFEAAETPDAQFAKSLDRFQPPLLNLASGGGSWTDYGVSEDMVRNRVGAKIDIGAPKLWAWISPRIASFFKKHMSGS